MERAVDDSFLGLNTNCRHEDATVWAIPIGHQETTWVRSATPRDFELDAKLALCLDPFHRFCSPAGQVEWGMRRFEDGGSDRVSESDSRDAVLYWQSRSPEERVEAIFEIRKFYYEVMRPGTGSTRLDRSVGGTRRLGD